MPLQWRLCLSAEDRLRMQRGFRSCVSVPEFHRLLRSHLTLAGSPLKPSVKQDLVRAEWTLAWWWEAF